MSIDLQSSTSSSSQITATSSTSSTSPVSMPVDNNQNLPPYNPSAPGLMSDPYNMYGSGSDVYSKTYLALNWMIKDPQHSTNDAIVFLYFLSSVCAVADEDPSPYNQDQFNAYANDLLSIHNGATPPKTLVAECVDITMQQMMIEYNMSADDAAAQIDLLFQGTDPISVAVQDEAKNEAAYYDDNPDKMPTQESEEQEWAAFITDPITIKTTEDAEADMRTSMIDSCGTNLFAAIIVIMMLLQNAGIENMDAYGELSNGLQKETDQLNLIVTEWQSGEAYSSPEAAQQWMDQIQQLQNDMNDMPFNDTTMQSINDQFTTIYNQQAMGNSIQLNYPNGKPEYTDSNGKSVNSSGQQVDSNGDTIYYVGGKHSGYYVQDQNGQWYNYDYNTGTVGSPCSPPSGASPVMGSGKPTPVTTTSNLLYIDSNGQTYYKTSNGQYVNANTGKIETPSGTVEPLTIGDQAYGYTDLNGNEHAADSVGLQTSLKAIQAAPVNPDNPNSGGFSSEDQAIITSLNGLSGALSQQSALVGTEMQQETSNITLYQNTFSNIMQQAVKAEEDINQQT